MTEFSQSDRNHVELARSLQNELIEAAREAHAAAYCPYSNFAVGAAVLTADGTMIGGCNVENASYGLTICAERNAVFAAVAAGRIDIVAIAVVTGGKTIAWPCGACRQVIAEFSQEDNPIAIIAATTGGEVVMETINDLLPRRFTLL